MSKEAAPACRFCGDPLRPVYEMTYVDSQSIRGPITGYGYYGQSAFCSLRCGYRFGLLVVQKSEEHE